MKAALKPKQAKKKERCSIDGRAVPPDGSEDGWD